MNNLYGWAISSCLPYGGFKQLKNIDRFDVKSIREKSPIEYILEVDFEFAYELHLLHNDYPLPPEKLLEAMDNHYATAISYDML